jgi:hypothetical protein
MINGKEMILSDWLSPVFSTGGDASHWFGYYNISPLNQKGDRLLAHRVNFDGRMIRANDTAEVGWFDLKDGSWHLLGKTKAFNWQQGAMLQWLGSDFDRHVILNDVEENQFVSRVIDLDGREIKTLPWPVYAVTPDGKTSITLQFERSYWCRAYHYESIRNTKWNVPIPEEDGVFSVNIENGDVKRIIEINSVLEMDKIAAFGSSKNWLEHIMLNPSGNRFAFYHRYSENNGFRTRVFTSNLNGTDIVMVPGWQENNWSHLGWKNDTEFVLFGSKRVTAGRIYDKISKGNTFGRFFKAGCRKIFAPIIPSAVRKKIVSRSQYQIYRDQQGMIGDYSNGILSKDGHPSFTADGLYMLTDTYADSDSFRHLILFNTKSSHLLELGRFFSPFNSCGYRSDLHPRFSRDASKVVIDSAHSGRHQIYVFQLDWSKIVSALA